MLNDKYIVSDLKDPKNYFKYIQNIPKFFDSIKKEYDVASELKSEIKKLQKKIKSANLRLNSIARQLNDSDSQTDDNDYKIRKTVVLEPLDIIFTVQEHEVEGSTPNLIFEQKDTDGQVKTNYLYLNQSYKPFLKYL